LQLPSNLAALEVAFFFLESSIVNRGLFQLLVSRLLFRNLLTNGDFKSGTTGWTAQNSAIAEVSGTLEVTGSGGNFPQASADFAVIGGATYEALVTNRRGTTASNASMVIQNASSVNQTTPVANSLTTERTLRTSFTPSASGTWKIVGYINSATGTGTAYFDDFIVRRVA
jgi:hypothetical protein